MFFFLLLRGFDPNDSVITNCFKMLDRDKQDRMDQPDRDEIYSKVIRAGKRTYFFDVKATRSEDYYLTMTESKKIFDNDGNSHYEKHKIFLYKEDFDKFAMGFDEAVGFISNLLAEGQAEDAALPAPEAGLTSVEFEDLGESEK